MGNRNCCERHADNKACDYRPCHRCDGLGWYNEIGPNTFPIRCQTCDGVGKVPVTPDDSLPPPVSWSDWLAGCEGVTMPVVVLKEEPLVLVKRNGDLVSHRLRGGSRHVRRYRDGHPIGWYEIVAELLELEWPGTRFEWPGTCGTCWLPGTRVPAKKRLTSTTPPARRCR